MTRLEIFQLHVMDSGETHMILRAEKKGSFFQLHVMDSRDYPATVQD